MLQSLSSIGSWIHYSAGRNKVTLGNNSFKEHTISDKVYGAAEVIIADLQDDQDMDIMMVNNHKSSLSWFENLNYIGIDKKENMNEALIYPNPTSDVVYIDNVSKTQSIEVYSISGEKISAGKSVHKNRISVDLSKYPKGIYLFVVKTFYGVLHSKVVKL